jgi:four helix bundle protein
VWQNARDAATRAFDLTKRFPAEARYSLTDPVRRSSRSVAAHMAEAWRKRRYVAAFVSNLNDAESEAAETPTWIKVALRCEILSSVDASRLDEQYEQILRQLVTMIERAGEWLVGPQPRESSQPSSRMRPLSRRSTLSASRDPEKNETPPPR